MNKKEQFLKAVRILAPKDSLLLSIARQVDETTLPAFPGGAALEFVADMQRWFPSGSDIPFVVGAAAGGLEPGPDRPIQQLSMSHAVRIRSAEYWLELGEPEQALQELDHLPERGRWHPHALKIRLAAMAALRERGELWVQA